MLKKVAKEIECPVELFDCNRYESVFQDMRTGVLTVFQTNDKVEEEASRKEPTPYQTLKKSISLSEKTMLTLEEAAVYSGVGIHKLRELTNQRRCKFVLWNGNKRLIKRRLLDEYLEQANTL